MLLRIVDKGKFMRYPSKTVKQIFAKQTGKFEQLLGKVEEIKMLNEVLQSCLEPILVSHCEVANFRSGCLVIMADSSSWATRLRYTFPDLLGRLHFERRLFDIVSLHCIVRKEFTKLRVIDKTPKLSAQSEKILASLLRNL